MGVDDLATYILEEEDISQKMLITYYLSKKTGIFFDKSIVLKTIILKLFIDYMKLDVNENLALTAMLLCNCKKVDNVQKIGKLETYAKEGADYLATLGFNKRFCKICEEVNRYSGSEPRERESDLLELADQFTGLILNRVERDAFTPEEALIIIRERNLKYVNNFYIDELSYFVDEMENITIKETIDVPIIKKLVHIHNEEASAKTFIANLTNNYLERIEDAIREYDKEKSEELFEFKNVSSEEDGENVERMKKLVKATKDANKAMFTDEIAEKILTHKSKYKLEN